MGQEQIAHICRICRKAFKTRKKAKQHVNDSHIERVKNKFGPGQHVSGLWLDLRIEGEKHEHKISREIPEKGAIQGNPSL